MRARFFGAEASTRRMSEVLQERLPDEFVHEEIDIRDADGVERIFAKHAGQIELIVHTAAQPSHDWAAKEPQTDFGVNANGTLNLLEAARKHAIDAPFIFCSTNKVYGDTPNRLPLEEHEERLELPRGPRVLRRHPHVDVDRRLDALAVRRLQGRRRPAGAGVRALLRHADRGVPRRLPDRPQPRRHAAARLPLLPDALHDHRPALHRVRVRGQAGARQHPLRRPRRRLRGVRARRRAPPPSTTSAAGARATARCSRRSACARRSPGASWTGRTPRRTASATTAGGSPTSPPFERDHPDWSLRYSVEDILRQIHDANVEHWATA